MGRYDPLQRHLSGQHGTEVELSFADLERIIGGALPKAAGRPGFWANDEDAAKHPTHRRAWTAAGFKASLVPGSKRVRFLRHGYKVVWRGDGVTFIAKESPIEEEIARAGQAWQNLVKLLARTAVEASLKDGIHLDMDDPEVAREVMKATFEGLFLAKSAKKRCRAKGTRAA